MIICPFNIEDKEGKSPNGYCDCSRIGGFQILQSQHYHCHPGSFLNQACQQAKKGEEAADAASLEGLTPAWMKRQQVCTFSEEVLGIPDVLCNVSGGPAECTSRCAENAAPPVLCPKASTCGCSCSVKTLLTQRQADGPLLCFRFTRCLDGINILSKDERDGKDRREVTQPLTYCVHSDEGDTFDTTHSLKSGRRESRGRRSDD